MKKQFYYVIAVLLLGAMNCAMAIEPVTLQPQGPVVSDLLVSVQGHLTDQQSRVVLTPGTKLYNRWAAQVDSVAVYLKKLQEARIPVLWRPYHE